MLSLEACRPEKYYGVLDLLTAKTSQRFLVLREHAEDATVRAVKERFVLVGNGGGFEMFGHFRLTFLVSNNCVRVCCVLYESVAPI